MKTSKLLAYGLTLTMFLALGATFVPSAAAQGVAVQIEPLAPTNKIAPNRLAPETSTGEIVYKFKVSIPATSNASPAVCPLYKVTVTFTYQKPDYASVTLTPSVATVELDAQRTSQEVSSTMFIVIDRKAPAFKSDTYAVTATVAGGQATAGCTVTGTPNAKSEATVVNDYLPIMEYVPAKYIQKTGQNKDVLFPIKVTNFGNGQTRVTTTVTQPNKNKLDAVLAPSQTTLNTILESKTDVSKDIVVTARTPHSNGYTNQLYSFNVAFSATAVQSGQEILKDDQGISLSVQVQGVYVPGFDPSMAIGALGIGLVLMGVVRRRSE